MEIRMAVLVFLLVIALTLRPTAASRGPTQLERSRPSCHDGKPPDFCAKKDSESAESFSRSVHG